MTFGHYWVIISGEGHYFNDKKKFWKSNLFSSTHNRFFQNADAALYSYCSNLVSPDWRS